MICIEAEECTYIRNGYNYCKHADITHARRDTCRINKEGRGQGYGRCKHTFCIKNLKQKTKQ